MEEQEEILLLRLEAEGMQIAKYRSRLISITSSGRIINSSQLLGICNKLNNHIKTFDNINAELSRLEEVHM